MSHVVLWNKPEGWEVKSFVGKKEADEYAAWMKEVIKTGASTVTEVLVAPLGELAALWKGKVNA